MGQKRTAWNENKEQVVRMKSTFRNGILEKMLYVGKFSKMTKPDMCQQWNVTEWEMNVNKRGQGLKSGLPWSSTVKRKIHVHS